MIISNCKNCKKTIALPYDSVDVLKTEATHVECFFCGQKWSVEELFMQGKENEEDKQFITRLSNAIHNLSTPEEIRDNIPKLSEHYGIDQQVIMEYANMEIAKKRHSVKRNTELLHFVKIEPGVVNLLDLEQRLDKALADSKHQAEPYKTIVTGDIRLRKKLEELQREREELLKQNSLLSAELKKLKEEIERYR